MIPYTLFLYKYYINIFEPHGFLNIYAISDNFPHTLPPKMCLNCFSWYEVSFATLCWDEQQIFSCFLKIKVKNFQKKLQGKKKFRLRKFLSKVRKKCDILTD